MKTRSTLCPLLSLLLLLAGLPALVTPLRADNPPTYLFQIDSSAVPDVFYPSYVARDNSNNIYVSDAFNNHNRVLKLAGNGNYLTQWGGLGSGNGQFDFPEGIAIDSSNNVYVVDSSNSRIEKFDGNGNYLTQWGSFGTGNGQFEYPVGIAIDSSNNVYVADANNERVEKFDSNGNYLTQWGGAGGGNGQFDDPQGIAVDSGNNVYVADANNGRVEKFDSNGNYLTQWGSYGSGNGQLSAPQGIAVDSNNNVYVTDANNERVEKFTSNGTYLTQWGSQGTGNGQFYTPQGIAVDSTGNFIYVADVGNVRIQVFANNPNIVAPIITNQPASQAAPAGANVTFGVGVVGTAPFAYQWDSNSIAISGATNATFKLTDVSFADSASYSVLVTNSYGSALSSNAVLTVLPVAEFVVPAYLFQIDSSAVPGGFQPNFMVLDSSNNVYVSDTLNNRVLKFAGNGNYLTQWGRNGSGNGQFSDPQGIAVDSNNNVYVADYYNDRVEKFDSNGNYLTQWGSGGSGNGQFNGLFGIAVDSNNDVNVIDYANNRVEKFTSNGTYLKQWGSYGSGNGQFNAPLGIAVDSGNNVYVTDNGNNRVEKFDSNGNYLTQWGSAGSGNGQFAVPLGMAVDNSNNVYVTDSNNGRVEKFDSNGNYLTQWGNYGAGNGQFNSPAGIAVDSTGNFIYVADSDNFRIEVFANNPHIVPPIITNQPASRTVPAGANVTFSVGVVGTAQFVYQWNSNNVPLIGATNATFTLTDVSFADSASYSFLVTNNFGNALSSNAVLAILPAVVMTQPASIITTTGAVLNGSVTVGSDETVVWFEWGTDTNYGNIAGETVVPGDNGNTNISTALSGLPGNIYHYRIDAANDFGIVYGNDQSFTNGFAPTATTLVAINSTNGTTLNATVNPRGWDTTVYFKWGAFNGLLTNLTPSMDVGAGAVPLNVSSFITGLTPFKEYSCQAVASNHLGTVFGALVAFYSFPFVGVPGENWDSVAASADGSVMIAVANPSYGPPPLRGPIYISTNSGAVWTQATNAPLGTWQSVACSADGSKIIAAQGGGGGSIFGPIYTSADTGATWVSNNTPVRQSWESVASSADGAKLVAADLSANTIYTSTNSGAAWMQATNAPKLGWYSIASSADGSKLAAVADYGYSLYFPSALGASNIYTSTNFGATWITNNVPRSPAGIQNDWTTIAASADGNKLIAAAGGGNGAPGYIFLSTNSGASWTVTATNILPSHGDDKWIYVASSADGSKLAAVSESGLPGSLITSTNSGATWITNSANSQPDLTWNSVALSADGARMVVTVGYPSYVGPIFTTQTTPSPVLNLSAADNVISWIIPSLDFTLQQSPDLMSWADLTNQPALNLTNLENQVLLPPPAGQSFFRLMH
jgi:DNA-binding beta-propeller fold protein YncE